MGTLSHHASRAPRRLPLAARLVLLTGVAAWLGASPAFAQTEGPPLAPQVEGQPPAPEGQPPDGDVEGEPPAPEGQAPDGDIEGQPPAPEGQPPAGEVEGEPPESPAAPEEAPPEEAPPEEAEAQLAPDLLLRLERADEAALRMRDAGLVLTGLAIVTCIAGVINVGMGRDDTDLELRAIAFFSVTGALLAPGLPLWLVGHVRHRRIEQEREASAPATAPEQ
jgi:hypothetical protein